MLTKTDVRVVGSGLKFPEGPVVESDGSILVCEVEGGALVRVSPEGSRTVVAELGSGANGAAFGPDGAVYVASNGGFVFITDEAGNRAPVGLVDGYVGGVIQRVDPVTGDFTELFTESEGQRLGSLNDVVFDADGGAYVVDTGTGRLHYMDPAAGSIRVAASGLITPNGAGLSPDGGRLYLSETYTGRVRAYDVVGPGELVELPDIYQHDGGDGPEGAMFWDGLAVDGAGNVVVADLRGSGVRVISPDGVDLGALKTPIPDGYVTCVCFGGPDGNTVYITSGGRGLLYAAEWPWPGRRLNFQP